MQSTTHALPTPVEIFDVSYSMLTVSAYMGNNRLALIMEAAAPGDAIVVSVNIPAMPLGEGEFFLNINSSSACMAASNLSQMGLISPTGDLHPSGYLDYPVYSFSQERLGEG